MCGCDADDAVEIPLDPEPIALEPCSASSEDVDAFGTHWDERRGTQFDVKRGRLPGKIIVDDGEEPPMALPSPLAPEPDLDRFVQCIEEKWKCEDVASATNVTPAFWQTTAEYVRPMPYCDDDVPVMPPVDDPDLSPRKKEPPRIWFPFLPKGTEVGGDEKELS